MVAFGFLRQYSIICLTCHGEYCLTATAQSNLELLSLLFGNTCFVKLPTDITVPDQTVHVVFALLLPENHFVHDVSRVIYNTQTNNDNVKIEYFIY